MITVKPGDKVVCVDTSWAGTNFDEPLCPLVEVKVYTVHDVFPFPPDIFLLRPNPSIVYSLYECPRQDPILGEIGFGAWRFRPLQDISLFKDIVSMVKETEDA